MALTLGALIVNQAEKQAERPIPLPIVKDSGPANPPSGARYVLEPLTLIEV